MQKCPVCGHENRPGVIFCEKCGANLRSGAKPQETKGLSQSEQKDIEGQLDQPVSTPATTTVRGTDVFPKGGALRLEIEGSPEPIHLTFRNREVVLGRRDPATGALPDVDMTPFAGYRMGVSRRHSQIRFSEEGHLDVFDLGSSNGTFLNGERLEAHYPYRLHDGDRVGLGQIVIRIFFETPAKVEKPDEKKMEEAPAPADEKAPVEPTARMLKKDVAPAKPEAKPAASVDDGSAMLDKPAEPEKKPEVVSAASDKPETEKESETGTEQEVESTEKPEAPPKADVSAEKTAEAKPETEDTEASDKTESGEEKKVEAQPQKKDDEDQKPDSAKAESPDEKKPQ